GLVDPQIHVRQAKNQVDDLFEEILIRRKRNERVLVTTLTKRMAEDLTEYYSDMGIRVRYLHAEVNTLERMDIIHDLRAGKFDVLIGINLLREGLDIPEVSLVAILDADKEGFLRSTRSLVQSCGRAARNVRGQVIMYADMTTASMKQAIAETNRRRKIQKAYNKRHGTMPKSIEKDIASVFGPMAELEKTSADQVSEAVAHYNSLDDLDDIITALQKEMAQAAKELAFERASEIRDQIKALKKLIVFEI
ncbi:MAG: UvrB/UvrC motif-containing protein, partial [Proteobacteria bacterium]|nr:UvrB/UvrC motif-containing protein [Pseudomonadota bacterium]